MTMDNTDDHGFKNSRLSYALCGDLWRHSAVHYCVGIKARIGIALAETRDPYDLVVGG